MDKLAELIKKRAAALEAFNALADKETLTDEEKTNFDRADKELLEIDENIKRVQRARVLAASGARAVAGQDDFDPVADVQVRERDPYSNEEDAKAMGLGTHKGLRAIACAMTFYEAGRSVAGAREMASAAYGERHSITRSFELRRTPGSRALVTAVGASGGYIVPPDYVNEIIELLRPKAVVRSSMPRTMPMPRGTMTLPGQASAATASYGTEVGQIAASQQTLDQKVASFKKLTALTPVSNDMMRFADPAADAFVRDDLVKVMALREDLAFLLGDGTASSPRGMISFANAWAVANGGTAGNWSTTANSTLAVNGTAPVNSTGGNFVNANTTVTLATAKDEIGQAANLLDLANVPEDRRMWFMNPRARNFFKNVQNSLGLYVFRDEILTGKLNGYPFKVTTQIGNNYWDASGTNKDCSFLILCEMDEAMLFDSMSLELFISREGSYVDTNGNTQSAVQNDQTIVRAIAEHDFLMRHDQSVAVIQNARYTPANAP